MKFVFALLFLIGCGGEIVVPVEEQTETENDGSGGGGDSEVPGDNDPPSEPDALECNGEIVCHLPPGNIDEAVTICVSEVDAVVDHLEHGDYPGVCIDDEEIEAWQL